MADKLSAFLVDVAEDPNRLAQFSANAQRELDRAGLTDAQKTAVLTRDSRKVRAALGTWALAANDDVLEVPGPPPPPPPTSPPPRRKPPAKRKPPKKKRPPKRKRPRRPPKRPTRRKRAPSRPSRKKR